MTFREQEQATGAVPSIGRSSSSASATRSATGASASSRRTAPGCTPWALAASARLQESLGVDAHVLWSDDGIAFHFPTPTRRPRPSSWSSTRTKWTT